MSDTILVDHIYTVQSDSSIETNSCLKDAIDCVATPLLDRLSPPVNHIASHLI